MPPPSPSFSSFGRYGSPFVGQPACFLCLPRGLLNPLSRHPQLSSKVSEDAFCLPPGPQFPSPPSLGLYASFASDNFNKSAAAFLVQNLRFRFSLDSTDPRRAFWSSLLRCSSSLLHSSVSLDFGHLILFLCTGGLRLLVCGDGLIPGLLGGTAGMVSWGLLHSLSSSCLLSLNSSSTTLGQTALWFSTWPLIPLL